MAADLSTRVRLLAHPITTGALALLVVNDRVLKPWAGGLTGSLDPVADVVTGKLSDVAGVLLVAVLVGVVTGRRRPSLAAVGLAFAALKLSPPVASAAAPLLGGVTRTDATDLLALLVALPVADLVLRRAEGRVSADLPSAAVARRAPGPLLTALVLLLTVPAVTATSCNEPEPLDTVGVGADGDLYARIGPALSPEARAALVSAPVGADLSTASTTVTTVPVTGPDGREVHIPDLTFDDWARSEDGGRTWVTLGGPPPDALAILSEVPEEGVCLESGTCYRVTADEDGRGLVEEARGGTWATSFAFSDEEWDRMELRSDDCSGGPDSGDGFRSVAVVDDTVLVTMGSQGILRREGGAGWERIAVGGAEPLRTDGPAWLSGLVVMSPGVLCVGAVAVLLLALLLGRGWVRALVAAGVALAGAAVLLPVAVFLGLNAVDYASLGPGVALAAAGVFVVSLLIVLPPGRRGRRQPIDVGAMARPPGPPRPPPPM